MSKIKFVYADPGYDHFEKRIVQGDKACSLACCKKVIEFAECSIRDESKTKIRHFGLFLTRKMM